MRRNYSTVMPPPATGAVSRLNKPYLINKELPHMTWSDGLEEGIKLVLAAIVGGLYQRLSLTAKLAKIERLEIEVQTLKLAVDRSATKEDLSREIYALKNIMEIQLTNLAKSFESLNHLVQRALEDHQR